MREGGSHRREEEFHRRGEAREEGGRPEKRDGEEGRRPEKSVPDARTHHVPHSMHYARSKPPTHNTHHRAPPTHHVAHTQPSASAARPIWIIRRLQAQARARPNESIRVYPSLSESIRVYASLCESIRVYASLLESLLITLTAACCSLSYDTLPHVCME
jgi:hypothetical protein